MSKPTTRLARTADLEAAAALYDAYRQFYEKVADLPLARRFLRERFERQESVLIVAEDPAKDSAKDSGGVIVGFTQLYPFFCSVLAARTFVLYDLFVTPAARSSGAGRALMVAAESHAREAGAARMELSTARTNKIGQSLYESLGWQRDEQFLVYTKGLRDK